MKKTNVMRILDSAKIPYTAKEYEYDENDLNGMHVAEFLGVDPQSVYKTLAATGDGGVPVVFCIAVNRELDLKKAAAASGNKRVELLAVKDLPRITGYIRGGCSPIGMKKKYKTVLDNAVTAQSAVSVSAGQRGVQVILSGKDLVAFTEAIVADITRESAT